MKFYSEILDEKYDTLEELEVAEKAEKARVTEEEEKARKEKEEKEKAEKAVEDAYNAYVDAYNKYSDLLRDCVKKYGTVTLNCNADNWCGNDPLSHLALDMFNKVFPRDW